MARAEARARAESGVEEEPPSAGEGCTAASASAIGGSSPRGPACAGATERAPSLSSNVRGGPFTNRMKG